jgi:muramoyltetrapeptide carboxypeptidase LdcA involved in peptidoglycan recycling
MTSPVTPSRLPFVSPPPARPGDRVAIVSPSWAGPGVFPDVHELGMRVLRDMFDLEPVEYPTTREIDSTPEARARDLMSAFADPTISVIMAAIGGDDQVTVLPHLDPKTIAAHPKRFFGYSDNTNLLNYLWNLGIVGFHGGSTMVHLARAGGPDPTSMASLRSALFTRDTVELAPTAEFTDISPQGSDVSTLERPLPTTPEPGWYWHNCDQTVTGPTWGGNLEILHWNLAVSRWIQPAETYEGCVLLLETSEEMPPAEEVFRMLRNMGERGLLRQFPAVVMGKPRAWNFDQPLEDTARVRFRDEQQEAVLRALADYNPDALAVFGPDIGHTDPQLIVPYGGRMTIDGAARRILMTY